MAQVQILRVGFAGTSNLKSRGRSVSPGLAECMEKLGYEISDGSNVDVLININHNWKSVSELDHSTRISPAIKILIRVEPSSVYPRQYTDEVELIYDFILTPGSVNVASENDFIRWPYDYNLNPSTPALLSPKPLKVFEDNLKLGLFDFPNWEHRLIECSLIAANKVSPNGSGNYGLRRKFAAQNLSGCLSVYGQLWKISLLRRLKYRLAVLKFAIQSKSDFQLRHIFSDFILRFHNVRGSVLDKHNVIIQSKFSLVIENTDDYVSEKLIDALIGGSIPIYFGPTLAITGIPEDLVFRSDPLGANLVEIVRNADEYEIRSKLTAIVDFLSGKEFPLWDSSVVNKEICARIDKYVRSYH